jgi:hypothetical protein
MKNEDTFSANIKGVTDLVESGINKVASGTNDEMEGATGELLDVLDLPMSDDELLELRDDWEKIYAPYESRITKTFQRNLRSYLGRQKDGSLLDEDKPGAANLQFESEETFLPAALARNPDPLVYSDNTPEGNAIAEAVRTMLQFHADQLLLKRKLEVMARRWSIYQLAVLKYGWNEKIKDVSVENRKIQDFLFDPDGFVDVYGNFSSWLGERMSLTAKELIDLFPDKKDYIEKSVTDADGVKLGTEVIYTEWWTDDYCFKTYKKIVLEKHKNEYFNYAKDTEDVDELGAPIQTKPFNHFASPQKPYTFLSVFSLQERPHDITGLIEQNIPNQAKISKRVEQIDDNVSQSNNGLAFSENNFNQETAKQASNALTRGIGKVLIPPGGPVSEAIVRIAAPNMPDSAFKDLENSENHLRSSWGVQGISSQQPKKDETARGMIMNQGRDTSRIGGGISDVIEQSVARSVFNWLVQLYVVFYDEQHFAAVMGVGKAVQYVELSSRDINRQIVVGVSPNSMKPKDEVSKMNQAIDLYTRGAIGPKILLETLDFPNPDEAAADGVLWKVDPQAYLKLNFSELFAQLQQMMAEQQAQQAQVQARQQGQETQQFQQGLGMKQAEHQQKLQQSDESHKQKLQQSTESASAKLSQV